jgi:predicted DsbA family dithiol-disulfide isomerase
LQRALLKQINRSSQEYFMPTRALTTALIDYYTDVLCVWAWIAQPRLDELQRQWGNKIVVRHRFVDIFGDSHHKIQQQWGDADGFEKFNTHVVNSAEPFIDTLVNPGLWTKVKPRSSLTAHLFLKAVSHVAGDPAVEEMALAIRRAFFIEGRDMGKLSLLMELAQDRQLDITALELAMQDGLAMASLSRDQRSAGELGIKGSPTWVLNEGRQILYGNIGYRILNANIEELLKHPGTEASWC